MTVQKLSIFVGHFGSGKSEIAVNYALKLAKTGANVAIVDLDVINPFFRTADAKEWLEQNKIKVITPLYVNTNVEAPSLPAEINLVFQKNDYKSILDVGGDDLGATVLARYSKEIGEHPYEMLMVVNTKRPLTDTKEKILAMIAMIEKSSKLKITKLVNNTNLLSFTTAEDVTGGENLLLEISRETKIPVAFTSFMGQGLEFKPLALKTLLFEMEKFIKLPWEKD